jgi:hypothetical protein
MNDEDSLEKKAKDSGKMIHIYNLVLTFWFNICSNQYNYNGFPLGFVHKNFFQYEIQ